MLEIIELAKVYPPATRALRGVSLTVASGEILGVLGPSGSGKSTLLRIVAGLERPDSGRLLLDGEDLTVVPVHRRGFGLMFQDFALFPDKSVAQNVAFGLRMAGRPAAETQTRVAEMLDLVSLTGYGDRTIFQLSGGERQRVALARSLAPSPRMLLLDEPLGSLDRTLREGLLDELRALLKRLGLTSLYVTHDQQEALAIADRVAVVNAGRLEQVGTPRELYERPQTAFVARFLGFDNLLDATVGADEPRIAKTPVGDLELSAPAAPGRHLCLIRPVAASLRTVSAPGLPLRGRIAGVSFRGAHQRVDLMVPVGAGAPVALVFHLPADLALAEGGEIDLTIDPASCALLPAEVQASSA